MEVGDLISEFRTVTGDHGTPPLWGDKSLIAWANEAQREAAIRAKLLRDFTTPEVVTIPLVAGQRVYRLHPKVFDIDAVSMTRVFDGADPDPCLRRLDYAGWCGTEDVISGRLRTGWADTFTMYDDASGDGFSGIAIVLDRVPSDQYTGTLHLSVYRLPLEDLEFKTDEPEIAQQHHMKLLNWILYRAYSVRDAEMQDLGRAADHKALFTDDFGEMPDANVRRKQRRHRAPRCRPERW